MAGSTSFYVYVSSTFSPILKIHFGDTIVLYSVSMIHPLFGIPSVYIIDGKDFELLSVNCITDEVLSVMYLLHC